MKAYPKFKAGTYKNLPFELKVIQLSDIDNDSTIFVDVYNRINAVLIGNNWYYKTDMSDDYKSEREIESIFLRKKKQNYV